MADIIQIRRDTASNWTSANPVLADGEMGYEKDTKKAKIGDGVTAYNSLPYVTISASGDLVQGTNVTLSGTLTGRLLGSGNVTISASGGGGGASVKFQNGYYIGVTGEGQPQQDILANGEIWYIPFPQMLFSSINMTATRISVRVITSQTGATIRLGIYSGDGAALTRVLDAGTVDASSGGGKEIVISQALTKGTMYWLAVKRDDGGAGDLSVNSVRGIPTMYNTIDTANELLRSSFAYVGTESGGAFPASATLPANSNGFRGQLLIPVRIQQ